MTPHTYYFSLMAYNALPPSPRGESRYIAAVIPNGLIKCILNNTKLGKKRAEAVLNVFIHFYGGEDVTSALGLSRRDPSSSSALSKMQYSSGV